MKDRDESPDGTATTRILIVEDDADDAELMTRELHQAGLAVTTRRVQSETALGEVGSVRSYSAKDAVEHTRASERSGRGRCVLRGERSRSH